MNDNTTTSGGIGFCGLLTIAFIVLKLLGVVKFGWLWVFAPMWIPLAIGLVLIAFAAIITIVKDYKRKKRQSND